MMAVISTLAYSIHRLFGLTWRYRVRGQEHHRWLVENGRPFIFSVWHGSILAPIFWHRRQRIMPMVSWHKDGEMIARTLSMFGFVPIRGSSTRGGTDAFHQMVAGLKNGGVAAVMPDGPRGPRHVFKEGTILIAGRAGAFLLPLTFDAHPKKVFRSWDRMKLPLPFARIYQWYGPPIEVPADLAGDELEQFRVRVETAMNELEEQARVDMEKSERIGA